MLDNLADLVVKEVHGSGGYGMLVGPTASKKERTAFAEKLKARPANYIAQPTLSLSTVPILVNKGIAPPPRRSSALRPRFRQGADHSRRLDPRGPEGRLLVVNSSQGGGTKDTRTGGLMSMLGRTANGLYWMFRYIERAENTARLIDAGLRMYR